MIFKPKFFKLNIAPKIDRMTISNTLGYIIPNIIPNSTYTFHEVKSTLFAIGLWIKSSPLFHIYFEELCLKDQ